MARRKRSEPQPLEPKDFTPDGISQGVQKLKRRIRDVETLRGLQHDDQQAYDVPDQVIETIRDVFGSPSPEFERHQDLRIWHGSEQIGMSQYEIQAGFEAGIHRTIEMLKGLIRRLKEKLQDLEDDPVDRARAVFGDLDLHDRIRDVSAELYEDGHYSEAVFSSSKALIHLVQEKSRSDLDGAKLMTTVFSRNSPILAFNDLKDRSDEDEQEGMMHLYLGATLAIRNPRGHTFVKDSPDLALDYIAFLSMLASRVDEAKLRKQ